MQARGRIGAGTATCALCREAIGPLDDAVITPDFLADDSHPFWPFSDATMHRACFLVWDRRKAFVALYNRVARRFRMEDGSYWHMTAEGDLVPRR
jgi:hypothetical protein